MERALDICAIEANCARSDHVEEVAYEEVVAVDRGVELCLENVRVVQDGEVLDLGVGLQGRELGGFADGIFDEGDVIALGGESGGVESVAQDDELLERGCGADELVREQEGGVV